MNRENLITKKLFVCNKFIVENACDSIFIVFVKQDELLKIHIKLKILVTKVFPFYRRHIETKQHQKKVLCTITILDTSESSKRKPSDFRKKHSTIVPVKLYT